MNLHVITSKICLIGLSVVLSLQLAMANDQLVNKAKAASKQQAIHNVLRESSFKQTESHYREQKASLMAKRKQLQAETNLLTEQFSENEDTLARLEEKLRLDTGSLGELFGVVRQSAKELNNELRTSVTQVDSAKHTKTVVDIIEAKSLPSMSQLTGLWLSMVEQIDASGELGEAQVDYINGEGKRQKLNVSRLGAFGLVADHGYVDWNGQRGITTDYLKQPENGPTLSTSIELKNGELTDVIVDPSRGIMLEQLAITPGLSDRLQDAGIVGKIILGLLAVGLLISLYRGLYLVIERYRIKQQLKKPTQPGNNSLGRVLAVYDSEKVRSVEALELRLLEVVVDEQQGLEKGLSMLKLLAALAPMLGLLGTVTGMIETFQIITQFGNGDPKVMAGGISMALNTTVLGLIAAMPLLLTHNILSWQAENIRNILEKQGIGLVAEQAENAQSHSENVKPEGYAA